MDLVSKNFIHHVNERIYLIASATDISTEKNSEFFLNAVISILGFAIYPMSLGLGLPVFMYNIVLEKEKNLKSIMKMHGLKDLHYWCVDWFFNIVFYSVGAALFIYTARNIFLLEVFKETSLDILVRKINYLRFIHYLLGEQIRLELQSFSRTSYLNRGPLLFLDISLL